MSHQRYPDSAGVDLSDATWRDWFDPAEAQDLLEKIAKEFERKGRYQDAGTLLDTVKWIESVIESGVGW